MDDQGLITKLLDGYSLRARMVPDPAMPTNFPEHVETYDLPHVFINGDLFWAKSAAGHQFVADGQPIAPGAFCYTNSGEVFMSFRWDTPNGTNLMNKRRYREHDWVLKNNYRLIWDSEGGQPAEAVRDEIDAAAKFRIAMLDSEGVWNIHPVDLPMYYPGEGTFELKTVHEWYVACFRYPAEFLLAMDAADSGIADFRDRTIVAILKMETASTYYRLFSDGAYQNYVDLPRGTHQEYKALRVYSDNLGNGA